VLEVASSRTMVVFSNSRSCKSRRLRARDLNLHLDFQERMITADSLLRYHFPASSALAAQCREAASDLANDGFPMKVSLGRGSSAI
jgi:hypothetical protein